MSFDVVLPTTEYNAGDTVKGKLIFTPNNDRRVHGIHIQFYGFEFCEFSIWNDIPFRKKWVVDGMTTVFGHKVPRRDPTLRVFNEKYSEEDTQILKAGNYVWPFTFRVPKNIPPTCEFRRGKLKIEYFIYAFITVPWGRSFNCKRSISIGNIPNIPPEKPLHVSRTKTFMGEPQRRLEIDITAEACYAFSGDKIALHVTINNLSRKPIQYLFVQLKRKLSYGTYIEKETIFRLKHMDHRFPIVSGKYEGVILLIVPNILKKPTILNASLCHVDYVISVRANMSLTNNLRVRAPIILCTVTPKKEKTMEPDPNDKNLIDLDLAGNPAATPLATTPKNDDEDDDSDDEDESTEYDKELQKILAGIYHLISELDTFSDFARVAELREAIESHRLISRQKMYDTTVSAVQAVMERSLKSPIPGDSFLTEIREIFGDLERIADHAKLCAGFVPESLTQVEMLQSCKMLLMSCEQLIIANKEVLQYDPFRSQTSHEYSRQMIELSVQAVKSNGIEVLEKMKKMFDCVVKKRYDEWKNTRNFIEKSVMDFKNPFLQAEKFYRVEDWQNNICRFAEVSHNFLSQCHLPLERLPNLENPMALALEKLLDSTKSVATQFPSLEKNLTDAVNRIGQSLCRLMDSIHQNQDQETAVGMAYPVFSENVNKIQLMADNLRTFQMSTNSPFAPIPASMFQSTNVPSMTGNTLEQPMRGQVMQSAPLVQFPASAPAMTADSAVPVLQSVHSVEIAPPAPVMTSVYNVERELRQLAEQSQQTIRKLESQSDDTRGVTVLEKSVHNITTAISGLLHAASDAHSYENSQKIHRETANLKNFVEKSREISVLISDLVNSLQAPEMSYENIRALTQAISAATAHFISAYRVKADPNSVTYQRVLQCAKNVTNSVTDILSYVNQPPVSPSELRQGPMKFRDQLETYAKIARLERELDDARFELGGKKQ